MDILLIMDAVDVPTAIPVDTIHFLLLSSGQPLNSRQQTSAPYRSALSNRKAPLTMDEWTGLMWAELRFFTARGDRLSQSTTQFHGVLSVCCRPFWYGGQPLTIPFLLLSGRPHAALCVGDAYKNFPLQDLLLLANHRNTPVSFSAK